VWAYTVDDGTAAFVEEVHGNYMRVILPFGCHHCAYGLLHCNALGLLGSEFWSCQAMLPLLPQHNIAQLQVTYFILKTLTVLCMVLAGPQSRPRTACLTKSGFAILKGFKTYEINRVCYVRDPHCHLLDVREHALSRRAPNTKHLACAQ
jgi:hypothetical protein